jgi:hypothetical protein
MKYWITIPDKELFVEGVVAYYTLDDKGTRTLRVQPLGDVPVWNRVGLFKAGLIKEEMMMEKMFRKAGF